MTVENFAKPWQRYLRTIANGVAPSGTLEITENGEYDVSMYATADVQVEGGGSSDFSTAEVTLNLTPPEGVTIVEEGVSSYITYPSDEYLYECSYFMPTNNKVNILLYNGVGHIGPDIHGYDSEDTGYDIDISTITVSGDIEVTEDFVVTGNGTISGTLVSSEVSE